MVNPNQDNMKGLKDANALPENNGGNKQENESQKEDSDSADKNDRNSDGEEEVMKGFPGIKKTLTKSKNKHNLPNHAKHYSPNEEVSKEGDFSNNGMHIAQSFLYKPFVPLPDISRYFQSIIEVRVSNEYMCLSNKAFKERNFWGSDSYTSESDVVCILQHMGYYNINENPPQNINGVAVYFRVTKGRNSYASTLRNRIRSKKMASYNGFSIKPESCKPLSSLGSIEELTKMASNMPLIPPLSKKKKTLEKPQKYVLPEGIFVFNKSFEPNYKYSVFQLQMVIEANPGISSKNVLYVESNEERYEIYNSKNNHFKIFKITNPFIINREFMQSSGCPIPKNLKDKILTKLSWSDFKWGINSLTIKNIKIENLNCFDFAEFISLPPSVSS